MSEEVVQEENLTEQIIEDAVTESDQGNSDPLVSLARDHGWKPEEEWKGDPPKDGFKTAEQFVKSTFEIQHRQAEKLDRLENNLNDIKDNMSKMVKGEAQRMRNALDSQERRLMEQRKEAIELADTDAVDNIEREIHETRQARESIDHDPRKAEFEAGEQEFLKRNAWFDKDIAMTADILNVAQSMPVGGMTAEEYYSGLEEIAKARYPHKFVNEKRNQSASVAGDSPRSNKSNSKTFDSLPPEAKAAWEEINEYASVSKSDYAKSFYEE